MFITSSHHNRKKSLNSAIPIININKKNPMRNNRSWVCSDKAFPFIFSSNKKTSCPPSNIGNGTRLITPKLTLINARKYK